MTKLHPFLNLPTEHAARWIIPTVEMSNNKFNVALNLRLHEEYLRGLEEGLKTARTIRNWLTRQPDRLWQQQAREWADKEIAKAEQDINKNTVMQYEQSCD